MMNAAPLIVKAQYIKDFSFEMPGAPAIFEKLDTEPDIEVQINVQPDELGDNNYEVVLIIEAKASIRDEIAFIVELEYAGLFELDSSVPGEYVGSIVLVECPRMLFPFARNIIASATKESGMPPLMLQPIDFNAIVAAQMTQGSGNA
ncbi:MAG: protein-export chaperone SecB [Rhodospirillaceae bacterium]|nr:protein-export chaperone SecB [Rhodospirillaceae bacterium]MCY4310063.1 protein-export chaperone SecB [Rhodospirillaceae bacterium]